MSGSSSSSRQIQPTVNIPPAEQTDSEPHPLYKPYVCDDCDQAFATSGHLTRHQRVHTGEMKYECSFPGCGKRCSRKDNLRQHYQLHFDVRDPEELKRAAPEKRRRKTRVTRVATVDGPGQWTEYTPVSPGSAGPSPTASTSDNSEVSRGNTPTPPHHSPSASSSSEDSSSSPRYGTPPPASSARQFSYGAARMDNTYTSTPTRHSASASSSSHALSFSSQYGPPQPSPYLRQGYPTLPPSQAQYAPPPQNRMPTGHSLSAGFSSSTTSFSSPQYGPPSTSSRIAPAHHSPTASVSSDGSSFPSPYQPQRSPPYFQAGYPPASGSALPFSRQGHSHAPSYGRPDMSASAYPTQLSPPHSQDGYPYPPRQPQQYMSPPADALGNAAPFSRRGGSSNERTDMPPYPPGPYDRRT